MERVEFPDAEQLFIDYLGEQLGVPAGKKLRPDVRFIRVRRVGGARRNIRTDSARMAVECYDAYPDQASRLAEQARSTVAALQGRRIGGVQCKTVRDESGPAELPDPEHSSFRYTFTFAADLVGEFIPL